MKRAPPQVMAVLYGQRDDDSVEIELVEHSPAVIVVEVRDPAYAPVACLFDQARTDPPLAIRIASQEDADVLVEAKQCAIVDAGSGDEREVVRARWLRDWEEEPRAIVCVRAGADVSPALVRERIAYAWRSLSAAEPMWRALRAAEDERERHEHEIRAYVRSLDLTADPLEEWVKDELARLDLAARSIDELEAREPKDVETMATASAKRRFLLLELHASGLLDEEAESTKRAHLERLELDTLAAYYDAAVMLRRYLGCPERMTAIKDADPDEPILAAPISLDWFRKGARCGAGGPALRPDATPFALLTYAESTFNRYDVRSGGFGEYYANSGGWSTLRWRKDDGIHARLLSLTAH